MSRKTQFLKEFRALLKKYDATFEEGEYYDGDENYAGSSQYIVMDGERFELSELFDPGDTLTL